MITAFSLVTKPIIFLKAKLIFCIILVYPADTSSLTVDGGANSSDPNSTSDSRPTANGTTDPAVRATCG